MSETMKHALDQQTEHREVAGENPVSERLTVREKVLMEVNFSPELVVKEISGLWDDASKLEQREILHYVGTNFDRLKYAVFTVAPTTLNDNEVVLTQDGIERPNDQVLTLRVFNYIVGIMQDYEEAVNHRDMVIRFGSKEEFESSLRGRTGLFKPEEKLSPGRRVLDEKSKKYEDVIVKDIMVLLSDEGEKLYTQMKDAVVGNIKDTVREKVAVSSTSQTLPAVLVAR
ncbi:hypothetical protein GF340_00515 [Candidatus Peregrinibacteria bacterium]|nr:hypothetical protein [Candidatus Peregrinibacteria bacterium]